MLKMAELSKVAAAYCGEHPAEIDRRIVRARFAFEVSAAVRDPGNWRFIRRQGMPGSTAYTHMLRFVPSARLEGTLPSLEAAIREEDGRVTGVRLW